MGCKCVESASTSNWSQIKHSDTNNERAPELFMQNGERKGQEETQGKVEQDTFKITRRVLVLHPGHCISPNGPKHHSSGSVDAGFGQST